MRGLPEWRSSFRNRFVPFGHVIGLPFRQIIQLVEKIAKLGVLSPKSCHLLPNQRQHAAGPESFQLRGKHRGFLAPWNLFRKNILLGIHGIPQELEVSVNHRRRGAQRPGDFRQGTLFFPEFKNAVPSVRFIPDFLRRQPANDPSRGLGCFQRSQV